MRRLLVAVLAAAAILAPSPVDAGGSWRGWGCLGIYCGNVHAYGSSTWFGHLHSGGRCVAVRIVRDTGDWVSIERAGSWYSC